MLEHWISWADSCAFSLRGLFSAALYNGNCCPGPQRTGAWELPFLPVGGPDPLRLGRSSDVARALSFLRPGPVRHFRLRRPGRQLRGALGVPARGAAGAGGNPMERQQGRRGRVALVAVAAGCSFPRSEGLAAALGAFRAGEDGVSAPPVPPPGRAVGLSRAGRGRTGRGKKTHKRGKKHTRGERNTQEGKETRKRPCNCEGGFIPSARARPCSGKEGICAGCGC